MKDILVPEDDCPKIANGMALALAYCAKHKRTNTSTSTRILCISTAPDDPSQYISIMNCVFAAQTSEIPIDVLRVSQSSDSSSIQLQQASHVTNGIFLHTTNIDSIIHHLMQVFLPDQNLRKMLSIRGDDTIDFTASCFCHKKKISVAYVCPVCLSIYCDDRAECLTCG
jgi:transcription initiation factor TFIIH subunit 3